MTYTGKNRKHYGELLKLIARSMYSFVEGLILISVWFSESMFLYSSVPDHFSSSIPKPAARTAGAQLFHSSSCSQRTSGCVVTCNFVGVRVRPLFFMT